MSEPLRVFIGYDAREAVAYHVLAHSIQVRASGPVAITPLMRSQLASLYTRERGPTESTDFSLTRFLVPYLAGYRGLAIYLDCDMLCQTDIYALVALVAEAPGKAVHVVQHDYTPRDDRKFLGHIQTAYPRKNWSSLMVFDLQHLGAHRLRPSYVNTASGLALHRFHWLYCDVCAERDTTRNDGCWHGGDDLIGALPREWNALIGEGGEPGAHLDAKILHYTRGGPWFKGVEYQLEHELWNDERDRMLGRD